MKTFIRILGLALLITTVFFWAAFLAKKAYCDEFDYYQDSRDFDAYRWEEQRRFEIEQDREERRDWQDRRERVQDEWDRNWEESRED